MTLRDLREHIGKLSAREQKLLGVLAIVLLLFVLVGVPIGVLRTTWQKERINMEIRALLDRMGRAHELLSERKQERDAQLARYAKPAPALAALIEGAAREHGLEVSESKDQPEVPHGKDYTERVTVAKMRKISLLPLVKTLEKIERSGYPVAVSRLNIKKRSTPPDVYDVELAISAFDRKADAPIAGRKASPPQAASRKAHPGEAGEPEESKPVGAESKPAGSGESDAMQGSTPSKPRGGAPL